MPSTKANQQSTREKAKALRGRTPRLDLSRRAESPALVAAVKDAFHQLQNAETHHGTRKRPRRAKDAAVAADTVGAVLSDLTYRTAEGRDGVTVSRSNRSREKSRYRSSLQTSQLPALLDVLEYPLGFITQDKGFRSQFGNQLTVIRPGPRWLTRMEGMTIFDATADRVAEEIVVLKDTKIVRGPDGYAERAEYEDDETTHRYRQQVRLINSALAAADVEFLQDAASDGYIVDTRNTHMRRIFTRSSFTSGGRLFGGWWLPIGRNERLANTVINGQPVVALDFKSMGAMLAYAAAGVLPPSGELYPTRFTIGPPGGHQAVTLSRTTVKKLFNSCLFAESPLKRWPRSLLQGARAVPIGDVTDGLIRAHPALAPLFFTGIGHRLQFAESQILVELMIRLLTRGITALPVHDAIVVAESDCAVAEVLMREVFEMHTGLRPGITTERAE